jgi:peroxiredoxin
LRQFEARGVQIVAVSVDPPEITRQHALKQGYTYTFLSDEKREVIRLYDLVHRDLSREKRIHREMRDAPDRRRDDNPKGGPEEGGIARPAEFLIDSTGTVRWVNLTDDFRVRARPEDVLQVFDGLQRAAVGTH